MAFTRPGLSFFSQRSAKWPHYLSFRSTMKKRGNDFIKNLDHRLSQRQFNSALFLKSAMSFKHNEFPQRLFFDLNIATTLKNTANRKISAVR
jgi:type IV secretory pathway VirD2 relaxase